MDQRIENTPVPWWECVFRASGWEKQDLVCLRRLTNHVEHPPPFRNPVLSEPHFQSPVRSCNNLKRARRKAQKSFVGRAHLRSKLVPLISMFEEARIIGRVCAPEKVITQYNTLGSPF